MKPGESCVIAAASDVANKQDLRNGWKRSRSRQVRVRGAHRVDKHSDALRKAQHGGHEHYEVDAENHEWRHLCAPEDGIVALHAAKMIRMPLQAIVESLLGGA